MTPAQKRLAFPLAAPRALTGAWAPLHAWCALVAAYHSTFFAVLTPPGAGHV